VASYGLLAEDGSVLGAESGGAYQFGTGALTQQGSINLGFDLTPRLTISAYLDGALTEATGPTGALVSSVDDVVATRLGFSLAARSTFRAGDLLTFSVGRPLAAIAGDATFVVATGREMDGTVNYETRAVPLGGGMPVEVGLGYRASAGALSYGIEARLANDFAAPGAFDGQINAAMRIGF
jgi:hypothetical protein